MNNTLTFSEKCLVEKCVKGDRGSQKELYEKFAEKMFSICLNYSNNRVEAEYILENGFVTIFNNLYRLNESQSLENWMKRVFVKTATNLIKQNKPEVVVKKDLEPRTEIQDDRCSGNFYHKVFVEFPKNQKNNNTRVSKLYAVKGFLNDQVLEESVFSKSVLERKLREEEVLAEEFFKNRTGKSKKANFSYTIQKEDYKRLNKNGILRVYDLNKPVDIPVEEILGKWRKEHVGITLVAVDGKWCIKGGMSTHSKPHKVVDEPLSFQLFKKFGW